MPEIFEDLEAVPRRPKRRGGLVGVLVLIAGLLLFVVKEFWLDAAEAWGGAEQQRVILETLEAAERTTRGDEAFTLEDVDFELGEGLGTDLRLRLHLQVTCSGAPPKRMPVIYISLFNHRESNVSDLKAIIEEPLQQGESRLIATSEQDLAKTTLRQIRRIDVFFSR